MTAPSENIISRIIITQLAKGTDMPYNLLLLADPSIEMINRYISQAQVFIATLNQQRIGVYVLLPLPGNKAEIKNIAVAEAFQGKGIGKFLLEDAAQKAKALGFHTLLIGTGNSSITQLYLYQRCGFEITSLVQHFFTDNYPEPIIENGIPCKHLVILSKQL